MKGLFYIASFLFISIIGKTQQKTVTGNVSDSIARQNLSKAVVMLLREKDSTLVSFARTTEKGAFEIKNIGPGNYLIRVYYPGYAFFSDKIALSETAPSLNFGNIFLYSKAHILEEVIVRQHGTAIRFKNDTTEFIADSFKVREGATVEDLLKKMPGFSIDRNGVITAQGQVIRTVLVDGDEFFGNDPTMVTRNLNGRDVEKVQLYDRSSNASRLTGIDDGIKNKTINVVLKNDAKNGYFGKAEIGSDLNQYYQGKLTGNRFTSNTKKGAYVAADRSGKNEMTNAENQDFGNSILTFDGSNVRVSTILDEFSNSQSEGIPENKTGAAMLNSKYGSLPNKSNTVNNYTFQQQILTGEKDRNSQYLLPDTSYFNTQKTLFKINRSRHQFNSGNEVVLDSFNTLNLNFKMEVSETTENGTQDGDFKDTKGNLLNDFQRAANSYTKNTRLKGESYWRRTFRKKGRQFSANISLEKNISSSTGFIYNKTNLYSTPSTFTSQIVDQKKDNHFDAGGIQGLISYQEPLSKKMSLNLSYILTYSSSDQNLQSFENRNQKYDSLNIANSSNFNFSSFNNKFGTLLNYTLPKGSLRLGLNLQDISIREANKYNDSSLQKSYFNFIPSLNYRTKINKNGTFSFGYQTTFQQPSFNQLQPIANNNDPLNIILGNPDLKPSFTHSFTTTIGDNKQSNNRSISLTGTFSFIENGFGTSNSIDTFGRRIIAPVNVSGNMSYGLTLSYYKPVPKFGITIDFAPRFRYFRINNIVNNVSNSVESERFGIGLQINKKINNQIDGYVWYVPEYNYSMSSINPEQKLSYFTHFIKVNANFDLTKNWYLTTNITTDIRPSYSSVFKGSTVTIWDISLEKKISSKKDIWAIVSVNDLLNDRKGIDRNFGTNFLTETTFNTIQRYLFFSLRWRFSKNRKINKYD